MIIRITRTFVKEVTTLLGLVIYFEGALQIIPNRRAWLIIKHLIDHSLNWTESLILSSGPLWLLIRVILVWLIYAHECVIESQHEILIRPISIDWGEGVPWSCHICTDDPVMQVLRFISCRVDNIFLWDELIGTNRLLWQRFENWLGLINRIFNSGLLIKKLLQIHSPTLTTWEQLPDVIWADNFDFVICELLIESLFQFVS